MLRLTPAGRALLAGGGFTVTDATSRALARRLLDIGVVHPVVAAAEPGTPVRGWLARYEAVRSSLDLGLDPAAVVPRTRVAYVPSAALLVRRATVSAGFHEDMRVAEDVDLVLRLHAAGWRLRYEASSRVAHDHRTDLRQWWLRKAFYGTGAATLALRHPGAVPPMVLSPWAAAVAGALLARRPLAAAGVAAWAVQRLVPQLPRMERPWLAAARIIGLGAIGAVGQTADAVNRHYWPLAALACAISPRARRTVAAVALVEGVVDWVRHRDRDPAVRPGLLGHLVAHRLDDLAYGAGLWWGALTHRTLEPLRPAGPRFAAPAGGHPQRDGKESTMTEPHDASGAPNSAGEVPDAAGLPHLDPPAGGMSEDPDSPDPVDVMPPRPGPPPAESGPDVT